jgi:hypothetical protein
LLRFFSSFTLSSANLLLTMLSNTARRVVYRRSAALGATRSLNVHEYISMEIMNAHHIKTPACYVAETPEEAESIFTHKLNTRKCLSHFGHVIRGRRIGENYFAE